MNFIMERRFQSFRLRRQRRRGFVSLRVSNHDFFDVDCFKIIRLLKSAEKRPQNQQKQTFAPASVQKINAQFAIVNFRAPADIEKIHFVFAVSDENERRFNDALARFVFQTDAQKTANCRSIFNAAQNAAAIFRDPILLLGFAPFDDVRIQADARIINENVSVNFADINLFSCVFGDNFNGFVEVLREYSNLSKNYSVSRTAKPRAFYPFCKFPKRPR